MDRIRILVADDHAQYREGLRGLLNAVPDADLVGEAATGEEAIAQAAALLPDVALIDIGLPEDNGIEAARRILHASPRIGVIVLTMLEDDDSIFAAMQAGARGYVLKGADKAEVLQAVRAVGRGEAMFGQAVARRMVKYFQDLGASPPPPGASPDLPGLTERERDVLDLTAQGLRRSQVAERLSLTPRMVGNCLSNVLSKLHAADRAQAMFRARMPERERGSGPSSP